MSDDTLTAIADSLDQLADEVTGNESRPAADDIAARVRQAAKRCHVLRIAAEMEAALKSGPPPRPKPSRKSA